MKNSPLFWITITCLSAAALVGLIVSTQANAAGSCTVNGLPCDFSISIGTPAAQPSAQCDASIFQVISADMVAVKVDCGSSGDISISQNGQAAISAPVGGSNYFIFPLLNGTNVFTASGPLPAGKPAVVIKG